MKDVKKKEIKKKCKYTKYRNKFKIIAKNIINYNFNYICNTVNKIYYR